jgi:hypothetical protein
MTSRDPLRVRLIIVPNKISKNYGQLWRARKDKKYVRRIA